jgi:hypothetical protein
MLPMPSATVSPATTTSTSSENISPLRRTLLKMDSASAASIGGGVSGLLREGWTGISEVLTSATSSQNPPSLSLNTSFHNNPAATPTSQIMTPSPSSANELLELTSRLTRQLKRAEETCRRIETREKQRIEVLRRCLIACCAKESAEVLEMALEIAANEEPDIERDSREFKELLIVRSTPDEQIEQELDRVAQLERELKEEKSTRLNLEEEKQIMEARFQTQQDGWEKERERYVTERKSVEDAVKERLAVEAQSFAARLLAIEQANRDRLQLETGRFHDRIKSLEQRLEIELSINRQRKEVEDHRGNDAAAKTTHEKDEELEALRQRVRELEDTSRPERELMSLARSQANRERVVTSLQNRVTELEHHLREKDAELNELKMQNQGAVPAEFLGPARGDYLRHVMLRYLTFDNVSQRQTLIPVISMLLNFNPDEKKLCELSVARDLAKEGIIGTLTSSLQAMPIQIFSTPPSTATPSRPVASNARYAPVSTQTSATEQNGD